MLYQQPQGGPVSLDQSHWSYAKQSDCLLFNGGLTAKNLVGTGTTTTSGTPSVGASPVGLGLYAPDGSGALLADHGNLAASDFTIRVIHTPKVWNGGGYTTLFDKGATASGREISLFFDASGKANYISVGGSDQALSGTIAQPVGMTHEVMLTRVANDVLVYVNGVYDCASAFAAYMGYGAPLSLGVNTSTGGANYDGTYHLFQSWTGRSFSASEVKRLYDERWGIFSTTQRKIWAVSAVGGSAATVIPIGVSATGSIGSPTAKGAANAAPIGVSAAGSVDAPMATGSARALPAGVSAASAVGTPMASGSASIAATVLPAGISATASVGAPVAKGSAVASAGGVVVTASVGAPVVSGSAFSLAAGVQATSAVGSPIAFGGTSIPATATPTGVQALSYLGTATASGASVALPEGIQSIGAIGTLIATGEAWCYPVGVQAVGSVGIPMAGDFTNRLTRAEVVFVTRKYEAVIGPSAIQYEAISGRSIGVTAH